MVLGSATSPRRCQISSAAESFMDTRGSSHCADQKFPVNGSWGCPNTKNPQVQQGNRDQRTQITPGLFFSATPSGHPTTPTSDRTRRSVASDSAFHFLSPGCQF